MDFIMTYDEIKNRIESSLILAERDIQNGKQIKLSNGAIINCYTTGKHVIQGRCRDETEQMLSENTTPINKNVFVVYGHDDTAKIQLEALLRRWDLDPVIIDQQAASGQTIIEKLETCSSTAAYAIVLATPDDEGKSKTEETYKFRVRQNVVLELGMLLAKLGRTKVAILLKEEKNFERPSDIGGLIYIPFKDSIEQDAGMNLVRELNKQGYRIDPNKL